MSWWQDILFALYILFGVLFAGAIVVVAITEFGQWRIARKDRQINKARRMKNEET